MPTRRRTARAISATAPLMPPLRAALSKGLPPLALVLFGWLLWRKVDGLDPVEIRQAVSAVPLSGWIGAAIATAGSFAALGHYDAVLHRVMGTRVGGRAARWTGMQAIAVSQFLGFGVLTGALVRWRRLPQLSLWQATRLSAMVALSFLASWAMVTVVAVLIAGAPLALHPALRIGAGIALSGVCILLALRQVLSLGWLSRFRGADAGRLLFWTAVDTGCAALALACLLPADLLPPIPVIFAAYLLALGAGLLSNAPGGVGAFELTLLALLPHVPAETLLGAVLAFRVVYYLVPAVLGLLALIPQPREPAPSRLVTMGPEAERLSAQTGAPSEWGLVRQGGTIAMMPDGQSGWLFRDIADYRTAIGPGWGQPDFAGFARLAAADGQSPILYKCSRAEAARARKLGWAVLRCADEAQVNLPGFDLGSPAHRQLRRKLRHAEKADIRVLRAASPLPLAQMAAVHRDWTHAQGRERGWSMGQFDPALLARQAVFLASHNGQLLGFVSFHRGRSDWTLDLMRHRTDLPDGTMHALIVAGLEAARAEGVPVVSLAAVPKFPGLAGQIANRRSAGLRQFKQSFGPEWAPRYIAAPTRVDLLRAGIAVARAIHRPGPLPSTCPGPAPGFQFDPDRASCDVLADNYDLRATARQRAGHPHVERPFPPS